MPQVVSAISEIEDLLRLALVPVILVAAVQPSRPKGA